MLDTDKSPNNGCIVKDGVGLFGFSCVNEYVRIPLLLRSSSIAMTLAMVVPTPTVCKYTSKTDKYKYKKTYFQNGQSNIALWKEWTIVEISDVNCNW